MSLPDRRVRHLHCRPNEGVLREPGCLKRPCGPHFDWKNNLVHYQNSDSGENMFYGYDIGNIRIAKARPGSEQRMAVTGGGTSQKSEGVPVVTKSSTRRTLNTSATNPVESRVDGKPVYAFTDLRSAFAFARNKMGGRAACDFRLFGHGSGDKASGAFSLSGSGGQWTSGDDYVALLQEFGILDKESSFAASSCYGSLLAKKVWEKVGCLAMGCPGESREKDGMDVYFPGDKGPTNEKWAEITSTGVWSSGWQEKVDEIKKTGGKK